MVAKLVVFLVLLVQISKPLPQILHSFDGHRDRDEGEGRSRNQQIKRPKNLPEFHLDLLLNFNPWRLLPGST